MKKKATLKGEIELAHFEGYISLLRKANKHLKSYWKQ